MRKRLLQSLSHLERELLMLHDQERPEALEREREAFIRQLRRSPVQTVPTGSSRTSAEPDFSLDAIAGPYEGEYVEDEDDGDEPVEPTLDYRPGRKADWVDVMLAGCYDEGLDTVEDPFDQLGFSCDFDGLTVETRWDPLEGIKHLSPMWLKDPDAAPNWAFDPPGHDPDERWRREELYLLLMQEAEITLELYLSELPAKDPITLEDAERAIARLDDFDFEGLQGIDDVVRRFARATTLSRARGRMSYHEWELNRQAKIRHRQAEKARLAALSEPERREVEETRAALELIGELEPEEEIVEEQATTTPKVVTSSAVDPILAAMGIA